MDIEEALVTYLRLDYALGQVIAGRISPHESGQRETTYPRVTYEVIDDEQLFALNKPTGLMTARIQVDVWATTRKSANDVARLIRDAKGPSPNTLRLDGFRGLMGGVLISKIKVENHRRMHESPKQGSNTARYRSSLDLIAVYDDAYPGEQ